MKEFTVGDMIKALAKMDPDLPIYDHYYDEDVQQEIWFNMAKPKPKKQTIYLQGTRKRNKVTLAWTDEKSAGTTIESKKVVILYPPEKGVIEF